MLAPLALAAQNPKTQPTTHKPQPTGAAITAGDLETRLYIYAADSMEGRETGTRGHVRATDYIAAQVKALGLVPMGDNGTYFQNVPVIRRSLDPASTISAPGVTLHAGTDFIAHGARQRPLTRRRADHLRRHAGRHDGRADAGAGAGQDDRVPRAGRGGSRTRWVRRRWSRRRAVAATARVRRWRARRRDRSRSPISSPRRRFAPRCIRARATCSSRPMRVIPRRRRRSPSRAPRPSSCSAPRSTEWPRDTTGKTVSFNVKFVDTPAPARNVVAAYPGHDAKLKSEWVAMGAHNDHIGIRQGAPIDHDSLHLFAQAAYPIRERIALYNLENHICGGRQQTECSPATPAQQSHLDSLNAQIAAIHINLDSVRKVNGGVRLDSISNGADDDGSGTVTLLEIAEKFAKSKPETKRSMLFVWHVGEEKGLWGSQYITDHPPVPRDSIVAQLNMDMVGRGAASDLFEGGPTYVQLVGGRRVSTELGDIVEAQNKKLAQPFTFDYQYDANGHPENIYCRSDHFNYARYGIPIVFVTTGLHGDYHQVTDEPEYIDYPHMAKIGNFMYDLGVYVSPISTIGRRSIIRSAIRRRAAGSKRERATA